MKNTIHRPLPLAAVLGLSLFATSCLSDLRPNLVKEQPNSAELEEKGRALLQQMAAAQGAEALAAHETFEVTAQLDINGMWDMINMDPLRSKKNQDIRMSYVVNSFDGRIKYLNKKRAGDIYGLQAWETYVQKKGETQPTFKKKKRWEWGLAAFHYMLEVPLRIQSAPIVRYGGEREFEGTTYDLVLASWGGEKPSKKYDQYVFFINKTTHLADMVQINIREHYMPVPGFLYGTVRYLDRTEVEPGLWMPTRLAIQMFQPKKKTKGIINVSFKDYSFDSIPVETLRPNGSLPVVGDEKPSVD